MCDLVAIGAFGAAAVLHFRRRLSAQEGRRFQPALRGGPTAPGAAIGLGFSYGLGSLPVALTGDYQFERLDRRTTITAPAPGSFAVPIATSIGRLGVAVRL